MFGYSDVNPEELYQLMEVVDTISVTHADGQTIYATSCSYDIDSLRNVFRVEGSGTYNITMKTSINLRLSKNGREVFITQMLSFHSLNCSLWEGDAYILDPLLWSKWFDKRGIPHLLSNYETHQARLTEKRGDVEEAKKRKLLSVLSHRLSLPNKTYLKMSGEIEEGALVVIEVINSCVTRQIWVVSSGLYWASPLAEKDPDWFFTDQPEIHEDDLVTIVELDAVQISESDFESLWFESQSS